MRGLLYIISIFIAMAAAGTAREADMKLESKAFKQGQAIPKKFTCQGGDVSPELVFLDTPQETKSFALIVDDPDAPSGTFDHWIAWNIPGNAKGLPEGGKPANQGKNGFGNVGYGGPCPPPGKPHRYFFKLYALDTQLNLPNGASKEQLESALEGHVIEQAELMGIFAR